MNTRIRHSPALSVVLILIGLTQGSLATLLVYEGFDYQAGGNLRMPRAIPPATALVGRGAGLPAVLRRPPIRRAASAMTMAKDTRWRRVAAR